MQPGIWYETWLDSPAERGLRPTLVSRTADLPGRGVRRRIGHALIAAGTFLAAEPRQQRRSTAHAPR
jgi:hypothetical protein